MEKAFVILLSFMAIKAHAMGAVTSGGINGELLLNCWLPTNNEHSEQYLLVNPEMTKDGLFIVARYNVFQDRQLVEQIADVFNESPALNKNPVFIGKKMVLTVNVDGSGIRSATLVFNEKSGAPLKLMCQ